MSGNAGKFAFLEQVSYGLNIFFTIGSLSFLACLGRTLSRFNYIPALASLVVSIANFSALYEHRTILLATQGLSWIVIGVLSSFLSRNVTSQAYLCIWATCKFLTSAAGLVFMERQATWHDTALIILELAASILLVIYLSQSRLSKGLYKPLLDSDEQKDEDKASVYNAGFVGRLFFTWLNPLLSLWRDKVIGLGDIPSLGHEDSPSTNYEKFLEVWESKEHPTIVGTLAECHYKSAVISGIYALFKSVIISSNPILLQYFIRFSSKTDSSAKEGLGLIAVLFVLKVLENFSQRHWLFEARRMGIRVRSSLMAAIYDKELRLSHEARQRHSTGEITSYIAVDTFRLGEYAWWLHQAWTGPLQILIALGILSYIVGWATVPGLLVIIATATAQIPLAKAHQKAQYNFMMEQDERLRTTTAILSNMKIVKLQAWEDIFKRNLKNLREKELGSLSTVKNIWAVNNLSYWMSPSVTAAVVLLACIPLGVTLDATVIFTVLATFRVIQEPIRYIPEVLTATIQAKVSIDRLSRYFLDEELQRGATQWIPELKDDCAILIEDGSWGWKDHKPTVSNVDLRVGRAELVAVCGKVGSGKSTLLLSILGETPKLSGQVTVQGRIAYVPQTAWIQSGTVRDNILFGLPFEEPRYQEALGVCCLREDISYFSHGDLTEIGGRGLNLSGGQKQRVQLARALYSNADIYLLDDPFSALDAHTGSAIFKKYVLEALASKAVILVTHQVDFLQAVKTVLVMEGGRILSDGTSLQQFVDAWALDLDLKQELSEAPQQQCSTNQTPGGTTYYQLTQEEQRSKEMGLRPLKKYFQTSKALLLLLGLNLWHTSFSVGSTLSNYWLAVQVSNPAIGVVKLIGVFAAISFASTGLVYGRSKSMVLIGLRASRTFFSRIMDSLFEAPMSLFDSTPLGRILTRLSSDMSLLDVDVPSSIGFTCSGTIDVLVVFVIVSIVTWQVILVAVPVVVVLVLLELYYLKTAREFVRLNGITKAPLLNKTGETVNGAVTIRAFKKETQFKDENMQLIDSDCKAAFHTYAAYEWLSMRVELLGSSVITAAAFFLVLFRRQVAPGFAGLSLSYALSLNASQIFLVQASCNLANYIVSVERISQFMNLPKEAPRLLESGRHASSWPDNGKIELQNLQVRYQERSPLVLKGVSCIFPQGKRSGLVGRTGSGKTTLISALFRLVEPAEGRIIIDGVDISTIGLLDLRSRLGVIPQEAFLFRGTVRYNLDPEGVYSDPEIWQALHKCKLSGEVDKLDAQVSDEGENWSAGQRQLFCLARVLLKRSKILVLDEATASIDTTTDGIIQKVIREEFNNCTLITVAHRIPTVVDSDMILGLNQGYLVEYGPPNTLLLNPNSLFAKLVAEYVAK